ncbi:glutamyl-tRNA reductase [Rhodanobacter denitrificans]|uniref:glutamyl-tRNA reductase n=1 Tax=Rhodanobacter denitrificans TaxID=666685 RepID=UPI000261032B|nr:glutamyl-tRNA reductase [Rhodanobacter denitrificans]EIL98423.1 glutamyl-tRNA reductase [Rhodanobacter denitrificans]UJJ52012.1 glutamyl-tRNA reductase [Rhodanobacter denitrificans]UJM89673.1 glutamyl-tRNA reductase [Rhodanobacter denitrificans]
MPLIALGLNHLTAPVSLREQVAFDADAAGEALHELTREPGVEEAMILSTCNRTELYVGVAAGAEDIPQAWLNRHHRLTPGKLDEFLYRHDEDDAVRHMFRVATGLDSMVLGEPQILGQVKDAYQLAREAQSLKAPMDRLLQHTFAVAKRVRTDTRIGAHTVSVAFTAVRLAEQVFADLKHACVLLIGAGDTIELAARHLAEKQVRRLIVANRTPETAQELAGRHGGYAIALADLPQHLAEADIVISSTAARQPIVTRAMVEQAMAARKRKPMFMVDIAVPRDIEAGVGELPDVYLYGIDDLRQVIDDNLRSRAAAAHEAEAIIDLQVERYMAWRRALTLKNPALDMRQHAEVYRDEVLGKARAMLAHGKSPDEALAFLANTLTNKLLHHPSARLREAALSGDLDLLHAAGRLYGLDEEEGGGSRNA